MVEMTVEASLSVAGGGAKLMSSGPVKTLRSVQASTIEMEAHEWLWPDHFAIGELGLIVGMPDKGKGLITCDIAARVTQGSMWPLGVGPPAQRGNVVILSAEDNLKKTIIPRLKTAGAELSRVHIADMVIQPLHFDEMFNLATDLDLLRQKVLAVGDVKLILIDPISAYLGTKLDTFRTSQVRAVLAPLVALADELRVAIIGVMHFNKNIDVDDIVARVSDSLAFAATARHVFGAVDDPENKRRLFVKGKNNISQSDIKAIAYTSKVRVVGKDAHTGKDIEAPYVDWIGYVDISSVEAMQAAGNKKSGEKARAIEFLREILKNEPMLQEDVEEGARAEDISGATLQRAKKGVVKSKKDGPDGKWRWHLKSEPAPGDL
jgi:putative DNA primase/helicase